MAVTNELTLNRLHDLEVSLELLSFAGGENTISEDHVCKADEARVLENWDSLSLGGMERSKGFNAVVTSAVTSDAVSNGGFETWTAGDAVAPDDWTLAGAGAAVAKESGASKVKVGTYSAKLTTGPVEEIFFYQDIKDNVAGKDISFWRGKTFTMGAWVWCDTADSVRILLAATTPDAIYSYFHTGSSDWEYLTVTWTAPVDADNVYAEININVASRTAYVDGVTVTAEFSESYDLLVHHDDTGGTEIYGVIGGDLVKKSSSSMVTDDISAFTSGVLCHAVSVKDNGLYITNTTDGLKLKTVGNPISTPASVPPSNCARIYNQKNRLLAEGAIGYPNRVHGSRVGRGNWDEADAWSLANDAFSIDLPEDTRGIVPDFPSGDYNLVFTETNAYAIGNFPNVSFRAIGTPARGCSAPYSIAKGDEGVYFASLYPTRGIFLFDGTSFAELTELNRDVFVDKIDFTKRIFGAYRNRRYYLFYNETGSGVTYPNTCRIYDARFKRWMNRPINSALAEAFGYPAVLKYASWELYTASSKTNKVYELETEDNSDEDENTEATYTTKNFSSRDFAVASGGQFPIDDCRLKLLKMTITYFGNSGSLGVYWSADRGIHSGSKTIDLTSSGDLLNSTFIMNTSKLNASPQDRTKTYTFPNSAVGRRFYFQITNSGSSTRPKIKKIKITGIAHPEP